MTQENNFNVYLWAFPTINPEKSLREIIPKIFDFGIQNLRKKREKIFEIKNFLDLNVMFIIRGEDIHD